MRPTYWKHRDRPGKIALVKPTAMMMVTVGAEEGYRLARILDPEGNAIGITT